jgi:hypothetical protein
MVHLVVSVNRKKVPMMKLAFLYPFKLKSQNYITGKSRSFAGLLFSTLLILSLLAFNNQAMATVGITAPSLTVTACTTFPTASFTLGDIVIAEVANADISVVTNGTLILTAPTNFQFTSAGTATFTPSNNITSASVVLTNATTITLTISVTNTNKADAITISGIQVIGITSATGPSTVTRTGGTSVIAGDANGTIHATLTSVVGTASVGGTVSGSATVCTGTNSTGFTLSGHTGSITRWEYSTASDFSVGLTTVANTTTSLTATNLTATTYYRAVITSGACPLAYSTTGTVTVSPASVGGTVAGSATVCTGTNSTNLTLSGHTGSVTRWEFSSASDFTVGLTTVVNTTTSLTATNLTATTYYRAVITSGVCALAYSTTGTVTVSPASVGGTVAGSATVCTGTNSTNLT